MVSVLDLKTALVQWTSSWNHVAGGGVINGVELEIIPNFMMSEI